MSRGQQRLPWWVWALLAFLIPLLLYLLWTPADYSSADLRFAARVQAASDGTAFYDPAGLVFYDPAQEGPSVQAIVLDPQRLLDLPTAALMARLGSASVISTILPLRALVGALLALFTFMALLNLRQQPLPALIASLGLAVTAQYWRASTQLDSNIIAMALLSAAFYVLSRPASKFRRRAVLVGALLILASLYHLPALLAAVGFGVALAWRFGSQSRSVALGKALLFTLSCVVIVLAIIALLVPTDVWPSLLPAAADSGQNPLRSVFWWLMNLLNAQLVPPGVPGDIQAYWDSLGWAGRVPLLAYYGVIGLLLLSPLVLLFADRQKMSAKAWLWPGVILLLPVIPLYVLWLLIGLALTSLRARWGRFYRVAVIGLIAVTLVVNLSTVIYPVSRSEDNPWLQIAQTLGAESAATALFITDAHPLGDYLIYFSQRNVIETAATLNTRAGLSDAYLRFIVHRHIRNHRRVDGAVYLFSSGNPAALAEGLEIPLGKLVVAWRFPALTIYRVDWQRETSMA